MIQTPRLIKSLATLSKNKTTIFILIVAASVVTVVYLLFFSVFASAQSKSKVKYSSTIMEYRIDSTWDGVPVNDDDVIISLKSVPNGKSVLMEVSAPYYDSPGAPDGPPGPFFKLWDYEVVEAFFLGKNERYLEVELGPYGHHLLLFLNGAKNSVKHSVPLKYSARIDDDYWWGQAVIPAEYFPPNVTLFNAYAIHGSGDRRVYEALYPTPQGKYSAPDFHRLEYFREIEFDRLLPKNRNAGLSDIWKEAIEV